METVNWEIDPDRPDRGIDPERPEWQMNPNSGIILHVDIHSSAFPGQQKTVTIKPRSKVKNHKDQ